LCHAGRLKDAFGFGHLVGRAMCDDEELGGPRASLGKAAGSGAGQAFFTFSTARSTTAFTFSTARAAVSFTSPTT